MGLQYGYDATKGKWFAKGFMFLRYYDTEKEMKADDSAFDDYIKRLESFKSFANVMASYR